MFDNINIFYDDAEIHINEFTVHKVIRLLKKRIADGQKTAQNYTFLADAYICKGKYSKALRCALRAKVIDPDYYYTNVILISIYLAECRYAKAKKYLIELSEKAPEDYASTYYWAMILYDAMGGEEQAVRNNALKLINLEKKETPDFLFKKAAAYAHLGEFNKAFQANIKAISKDIPLYALIGSLIYLGVGMICSKFNFNLDFLVKFMIYFDRFCGVISKEDFYYNLTQARFEPDAKKNLARIEKAIKINPKPMFLLRKAEVLQALGSTEEAIEIYKDVLKKAPSYVQCYKLLAGACYDLNDYKAALEYSNLAILNWQSDVSAYYWKIASLRKLNKPSEAINTLEKLEKIAPEEQLLYYIYAQTYADMEDYNKALLYINKQLMKEKNAANYRGKMEFLFRLDRYEEGVECGMKSLEYEKDGSTYYWLATCQAYLYKFEEALENINKAILFGEHDMWTFVQKFKILKELGREKEARLAYQKAVELGYDDA